MSKRSAKLLLSCGGLAWITAREANARVDDGSATLVQHWPLIVRSTSPPPKNKPQNWGRYSVVDGARFIMNGVAMQRGKKQ